MSEIRNSQAKLSLIDGAAVFTDVVSGKSVYLYGKEEFVVYVKTGEETVQVLSTLTRREKAEALPTELVITYSHRLFDAVVRYRAADDSFAKTVTVTQKADNEIIRICAEARRCSLPLFRGGEGQPVFAEDGEIGFYCGCEFPAAANLFNDNVLNFTQAPFSRAGTVESIPVVYGIARGKAFDTFVAHIRETAIGTRPYRVYSDWVLRDDMMPGDPVLTENLTLDSLDMIEAFTQKSGVRFDTYLMDAFWFEDRVPYTEFKKEKFPHGIGPVLARVDELGMDFGLWFDINGIMTNLHTLDEFAPCDSLLGNHALCLACDNAAEMLFSGIKKQLDDCKIKAIKLDFGYFECRNPAHDHSIHPDEYKEKAVANFIKVIARLRQYEPALKVLCYNGWTTSLEHIGSVTKKPGFAVSPYWCQSVDYVYCGDPRPSETPFEDVADSVLHYTDAMFYGFCEAGMPPDNIDDDGVLVGTTNSIYRLGRATFRRGILSSAMRGTRKLHFYGDLNLLDDGDVRFYAFVDRLFDITCGMEFELLPGDPRRNEPYGYRASAPGEGYALVLAPVPYDTYYPLTLPGKCVVSVQVTNGELTAYGGGSGTETVAENVCPVFVKGGGYTLVHYKLIASDEVLLDVPLLPGDRLRIDTAGYRMLQLMFRGENGAPLRLPNGPADGVSVSAGGKALSATYDKPVWSGISHVQYDVAGYDSVTVNNSGSAILKMKFRRLE